MLAKFAKAAHSVVTLTPPAVQVLNMDASIPVFRKYVQLKMFP